jgi:hypothetical protein
LINKSFGGNSKIFETFFKFMCFNTVGKCKNLKSRMKAGKGFQGNKLNNLKKAEKEEFLISFSKTFDTNLIFYLFFSCNNLQMNRLRKGMKEIIKSIKLEGVE